MARLVVESGPETGMVFPVGRERLIIGRGLSCNVQVIDRRVSREHAAISFYRGGYVLEDLESRNGTLLNHQPLVGLLRLRSGDRLSVGGTALTFELEPEDLSREGGELSRVRLTPGDDQHLPRSEKAIDHDTAPMIGLEPLSREILKDPLQRLRVIYQVSDSLRGELEMDDLLWKIMDIVWAVANPHRGIIMLTDDGTSELAPALVHTKSSSKEEIIISQGIVNRSFSQRVAVLMADAPTDERFAEQHSVRAGQIRSAICTPLVANGKSFGVIYLDLQNIPEERVEGFTHDIMELVSGISLQAALAINNARLHQDGLRHQRMEKELEIARQIQGSLLPRTYPNVEGVEFSAICLPARQVGGDYYDFLEMPDKRLAIMVGDASGKGVPAAILISMVCASLRAQVRLRPPRGVGEIVSAVNYSVCVDALPEDLATLFILVYDSQSRVLHYTNAGHVPALLIRDGNSTPIRLTEGGPILGVSADYAYAEAEIELQQGDVLVLYTDGVTDSHNMSGELYAESRLGDFVCKHAHESADKIRDGIYRSVVQFRESNEQFDDLTLLVMKII